MWFVDQFVDRYADRFVDRFVDRFIKCLGRFYNSRLCPPPPHLVVVASRPFYPLSRERPVLWLRVGGEGPGQGRL